MKKNKGYKNLFVFFLLYALILCTGQLSAQTQREVYNVKLNNVTFKEAMVQITSQSNYFFVYEDLDVLKIPRMTKEFRSSTISQIMEGCLEGTGLTFSIDKKVIYIKKITEKATPSKDQKKPDEKIDSLFVYGKITDLNNEPLPGASVEIKGEKGKGVISDFDGNYKIRVEDIAKQNTLVFNFLGMRPQEIAINGQRFINVALREAENELEQIVVVGYGVTRKKDIAGSIENITAESLAKTNSSNFQRALQGKMSGVQITSTSGIPGSSFSINIRRRGSINADTQPLYIIDGVQVTNGAQTTNILTNADVLAGLNPEDIESISVLKDGASASIYGAQAANGVVIITTKKGASGKTKVSVTATAGVQDIIRRVPLLNGKQWAEFALLEYKNYDEYNGTNMYNEKLDLFKSFGWGDDGYSNAPTTNWYDEIFRRALVQNYQVSLSGGGDNTKFYTSLGYNKTDGIIKHTGFSRISGRLNLSHAITPWLTFNTNNTFSGTTHNQSSTVGAANPSRTAMFLLPGVSPRDSEGNYYSDLQYGYFLYNIPQMLELNEYIGKTNNLISANDLTFKILKGLEFKSSYNLDLTWLNEHQFSDPRTRLGSRVNGAIIANSSDVNKFQSEQVLTYNTTIKDIHRISAVAGFSYSSYKYHMIGAEANGVSSPDLTLLSSAATPISTMEEYSEWKMAGFFGRASYTFKDKYILTGTIRYDGSSRFGADNKWGTFPSVSFAWRMKEEKFLKDVEWLNDLKLRASYGITGNASIGNYVSQRLYDANSSYNGSSGIIPSSIGNQKLTWEKKHSKNVGLTAGIFGGRISANVDMYMDDTKDLLYYRIIPQTTGFSIIPSNMGGVRNQGIDIQLNTVNVDGENFKWETSFNISLAKNFITELQDGLEELGQYKVGKPITAEYVYQWAGVNSSDGRPMYYDKDGYITYNPTLEDRVWTKGLDPTFFGGMENTISWKNFTLSFFFQFQRGALKYWSDKAVLIGQAADNNLLADIYNSYWRKPGDNTWVPKPVIDGLYPGNPMKYDNNSDPSMSLIYESTDFIKLKNINLSYNIPQKLVKKLRISDAQIYANAYNVWTTTPYQGYDPESVGSDRGLYPQSKSLSIGIKINF